MHNYICLDCGKVFDHPKQVEETHFELDDRAKEVFSVCPYCSCEKYEETQTCAMCGAEIGKTQARFGLCGVCEENADKKFKEALKQFTKEEIEYLNNQYDGEYFGL